MVGGLKMTKSKALSQSSVISSFIGGGILSSSIISLIITLPFSILLGISVISGLCAGYMSYKMELKRD